MNIEDLLGRDDKLNTEEIAGYIKDSILVTGGGGSMVQNFAGRLQI